MYLVCLLAFLGCKKNNQSDLPSLSVAKTLPGFTLYTIKKGQQFCEPRNYKSINTQEMKFAVVFDSSAMYKTISVSNQEDIDKLYGFSDNNTDHHQFSARFGWNWSDQGLHLFAYVYNKASVVFQELGLIAIGVPNNCSIKINKDAYIFSLNGRDTRLPRASQTSTGSGYQLYPYFGGEEVASHDIFIQIKDMPL